MQPPYGKVEIIEIGSKIKLACVTDVFLVVVSLQPKTMKRQQKSSSGVFMTSTITSTTKIGHHRRHH